MTDENTEKHPLGYSDPEMPTPADFVMPWIETIDEMDTEFYWYRGVRYDKFRHANRVREDDTEIFNQRHEEFGREYAPDIESRVIPATIYRVHGGSDRTDGGKDFKSYDAAIHDLEIIQSNLQMELYRLKKLIGAATLSSYPSMVEEERSSHLDALIGSYSSSELNAVFGTAYLFDKDDDEENSPSRARYYAYSFYRNIYARRVYDAALEILHGNRDREEDDAHNADTGYAGNTANSAGTVDSSRDDTGDSDGFMDLSSVPLELAASLVDTGAVEERAREIIDRLSRDDDTHVPVLIDGVLSTENPRHRISKTPSPGSSTKTLSTNETNTKTEVLAWTQ